MTRNKSLISREFQGKVATNFCGIRAKIDSKPMTRDEQRAKCFEAMEAAMTAIYGTRPTFCREMAIAAFDALHGIARVNPIEATEEMRLAAYEEERHEGMTTGSALVLFRIMSAAGDLTNKPEK